MRLFIIGEQPEATDEARLLAVDLLKIARDNPVQKRVDTYWMERMLEQARKLVHDRVESDDRYAVLRGIERDEMGDDLLDIYGPLQDELIVEVFVERFSPTDRDYFMITSDGSHTAAYPIELELERIKARRIPLH